MGLLISGALHSPWLNWEGKGTPDTPVAVDASPCSHCPPSEAGEEVVNQEQQQLLSEPAPSVLLRVQS